MSDTAASSSDKRTLTLLIVPLIAMVTANYVAGALWATLQYDHPALLITLSSLNRYLILVSNSLDPVTFFGIGFIRLTAPDPLLYLIGFWYGEAAIKWLHGSTPTVGSLVRRLEKVFGKWGYPLVVIMPNTPVSLLAGASRMRPSVFAGLNVIGTIGRLILIRWLGEAFQAPITSFQDWVAQYRWWLVAASSVAVGFFAWNEWRRGDSQIERLLDLDDELAGDEPSDGHESRGSEPQGPEPQAPGP